MGKRKRCKNVANTSSKRFKGALGLQDNPPSRRCDLAQSVLVRYFEQVLSLKDYILQALPTTSRLRKRRIQAVESLNSEFAALINHTFVACTEQLGSTYTTSDHELKQFTQTHRAIGAQVGIATATASAQQFSLDEVIDFTIWSLFRDNPSNQRKPKNILCNGLERSVTATGAGLEKCKPFLPGILRKCPNPCLEDLKQPAWHQLLALLGRDGHSIFSKLLLNCSIFKYVSASKSYFQLVGVPIHDLVLNAKTVSPTAGSHEAFKLRKLSEVCLARNRILYGRPCRGPKHTIAFGLSHVHVLNKTSSIPADRQDIILLQYIFPRQFKLHNVFTSEVNKRETVQILTDYTVREDVLMDDDQSLIRVPQRLYDNVLPVVRRLRRKYRSCSFSQLMAHHCPIHNMFSQPDFGLLAGVKGINETAASDSLRTQTYQQIHASDLSEDYTTSQGSDTSDSFLPHASSADTVSAFCQAVVKKVLPFEVFGFGDEGMQNWRRILTHVDKFVRMRRFETINLHDLVQGLTLRPIVWLAPNKPTTSMKLAASDKKKRQELLHELIYYVFDSLLIPLIAGNFYVTESGLHRNKLLFFRHDIWARLCQPHMVSMKLGGLVPVSANDSHAMASAEHLGYSLIRLLPKDTGVRMITNLRRRTTHVTNGRRILAPSINSRLAPVFSIFNYEKQHLNRKDQWNTPATPDIHVQLTAYKTRIEKLHVTQFYFVKVDIRSAFDSIPQSNLLALVEQLFRHEEYVMTRHAILKLTAPSGSKKPSVKFQNDAKPTSTAAYSLKSHGEGLLNKKHVIYSDTDQQKSISREQALKLLKAHIQHNIIKLGNKYRKQVAGIPQGSVLSSFLCTHFYDDFERTRLKFLQHETSLLLRVVDDFLLITTNRDEAVRFAKEMGAGDAAYGIVVHPGKSLVNFDITISGVQVPKVSQTSSFPFCGLFIDTRTLQVSKDRMRKDNVIANTLTVDTGVRVGEKLKRKTLVSLRIQLQSIVLDTMLNDRRRVLQTLLECFHETTMKLHQYLTHLPVAQKPRPELLMKLTNQLISYAFHTLRERASGTGLDISRAQICHLVASAMTNTLIAKQSSYRRLLVWLTELKLGTEHSLGMDSREVGRLLEDSSRAVQHYIY